MTGKRHATPWGIATRTQLGISPWRGGGPDNLGRRDAQGPARGGGDPRSPGGFGALGANEAARQRATTALPGGTGVSPSGGGPVVASIT